MARADSEYERNKMRGSKYVQSIMGECYSKIKHDLNEGRDVMFTGTPCQIAGVISYLQNYNISMERLYTVDIICHGVASPQIWKDNIRDSVFKEKAQKIHFRDKTRMGWHSHEESYDTGRKKIYYHAYTNMFYLHYILRPSCYHCGFCSTNRISDITIGDCWGIEKKMPDRDTNRGESIVLVNTQKGKNLYEQMKMKGQFDSVVIELIDYMQPNLMQASKEPQLRGRFWQDYFSKGYHFVKRKYGQDDMKNRIKRVIARGKCMRLWKE